MTFDSKATLDKHELKHVAPGGFICRDCKSRFVTDRELAMHRELAHKVYILRLYTSKKSLVKFVSIYISKRLLALIVEQRCERPASWWSTDSPNVARTNGSNALNAMRNSCPSPRCAHTPPYTTARSRTCALSALPASSVVAS